MPLIILGKISPKVFDVIQAGLPPSLNENTVILFIDFADADYPVGTRFTSLIDTDNPIQGKLIAVTQQFAKPVPEISRGWKTICAIEFLPSIPLLIETLPELDNWHDEKRGHMTLQPHQESVWDYPRPPRVEATSKRIRVVFNGEMIAETTHALRVLETSHPPVYYIPQADIKMQFLQSTPRHTFCEFKGQASYWTVSIGDKVEVNAAWSYPHPQKGFEAITDHIAFYPGRMDACYVDDELVTPQEGDFYGGWITSEIVGPFKGGVGTRGW